MFFSKCFNRKIKDNNDFLKSEFVDLCLERMNKITVDPYLPHEYKRRVEKNYLDVISIVSKGNNLSPYQLEIIEMDIEDKKLSKFRCLLQVYRGFEIK